MEPTETNFPPRVHSAACLVLGIRPSSRSRMPSAQPEFPQTPMLAGRRSGHAGVMARSCGVRRAACGVRPSALLNDRFACAVGLRDRAIRLPVMSLHHRRYRTVTARKGRRGGPFALFQTQSAINTSYPFYPLAHHTCLSSHTSMGTPAREPRLSQRTPDPARVYILGR